MGLLLSPIPEKHPEIYTGDIIDLCVLSPLVALIMSRVYKTNPMPAMPLMLLGFLGSFLLVPEAHQDILKGLRNTVLPVIEIGVLALVGYRAVKTVRKLRAAGQGQGDGLAAIRQAFQNSGLPPVVSRFMATEIGVLYYVFWVWKPSGARSGRFSMYRESGQISLCVALLLVLGIETIVLHRILTPHYEVLAWILSILSIYSGFYFLAHIKALWLRPTKITPEGVWFKNGILGEVKAGFQDIQKVEPRSAIPHELLESTKGLGLKNPPETFNMLIHFSSPQEVLMPHGANKSCRVLAVYIDKPAEFEKAIRPKLGSDSE
jgi:hypothetical protein